VRNSSHTLLAAIALIVVGAAVAPAQDVTGCCKDSQGICVNNIPANMCDGQFVQGGVCTSFPHGNCVPSPGPSPGSAASAPVASYGMLILIALGLFGVAAQAMRRSTR
jgi:hypothetical protein